MQVLYSGQLLDDLFEKRRRVVMGDVIGPYLAYRVKQEPPAGNALLGCIRKVACEIHEIQKGGYAEVTSLELCVETLCRRLGSSEGKFPWCRFNDIFKWQGTVSERQYQMHLFAAGIRMDNLDVVRRCLLRNEDLMIELQDLRSDDLIFGCYDELAGRFAGPEVLAVLMDTVLPTFAKLSLRARFFEFAAAEGRVDVVRFLHSFEIEGSSLIIDVDLRSESWFRNTWLYRVMDTPDLEVLRYVQSCRSRRGDTVSPYIAEQYPLSKSVVFGRLDTVIYVVQLGANPEGISVKSSDRCNSPIRLACRCGRVEVAEYLLAQGARPDKTVEIAAQWGHLQLIQRLLEIGIPPTNALANAAAGGYLDVVRLLLDAGADANATIGPKSPLVSAIAKEHPVMFRLLIERGADVHATGVAEECVKRAKEEGLESMLLLLQGQGVDIGLG